MNQLKFKKGDWCFCEFKLQQVTSTDENRITGVSDGFIRTGGYDFSDRCFPLDMKIKRVSYIVLYWSDKILALKCVGLNYPDINHALIQRWVEMCQNIDEESKLQELYNSLDKFGNDIIKAVKNIQGEQVDGLKLFKNNTNV